jgi:hypothetical protein
MAETASIPFRFDELKAKQYKKIPKYGVIAWMIGKMQEE